LVFSQYWRSFTYLLIRVVFVILLSACTTQQADLTEMVSGDGTPLLTPSPLANQAASAVPEETSTTTIIQPEPILSASPIETETILLFDGIEQGKTPEGFHFLGSPDAPVTLVDYSDFL
jgi:hypothetical protein